MRHCNVGILVNLDLVGVITALRGERVLRNDVLELQPLRILHLHRAVHLCLWSPELLSKFCVMRNALRADSEQVITLLLVAPISVEDRLPVNRNSFPRVSNLVLFLYVD